MQGQSLTQTTPILTKTGQTTLSILQRKTLSNKKNIQQYEILMFSFENKMSNISFNKSIHVSEIEVQISLN